MFATIGTWILTALLAFAFLGAGGMKLSADPTMVKNFASFGFPAWFLTLTGLIEVGAALLILIPRTAFYGAALLLVPTMVGAVLTHAVLAGKPAEALPATVLLLLSLLLAYLRRPAFLRKGAAPQA